MPHSRAIIHVIPRVFAHKYAVTPVTMPADPFSFLIIHHLRAHNALRHCFPNNIIENFEH